MATTAVKLDKSRPYGELWGVMKECPGAKFAQDGKFFDAQGNLLGGEPEPEVEPEAPPAPEPEAPVQEPEAPAAPATPPGLPPKKTKK